MKPHAPRPGRYPSSPHRPNHRPDPKPHLRLFTTTLWEYPSQHYDASKFGGVTGSMQGDKEYIGATPSWVVWQLLTRYTREGDTILDPMCGSGTTLDVCKDLKRTGIGFDLASWRLRKDIRKGDARQLPLEKESVDFAFVDPPYSTHIEYSDEPDCIGRLDALGPDHGRAYYAAMDAVFRETHRVLRDRRYLGVYVSDTFRKDKGEKGGKFAPIGFELYAILRRLFKPVDIIAVARHNQKLSRGNWHKAAEEGNYFLRGFNYLLVFKKEEGSPRPGMETPRADERDHQRRNASGRRR